LFGSFACVYIQDATHFSLPKVLAKAFPGSYSSNGESATAKVQAVFCLTNGIFSNFLINSFRDTDQKDAPRIIEQLFKGDLLIRDQGYFTLPSFKKILEKGAHFLSRLKFGVGVYYLETGERINLLEHLKKHGFIDQWVAIGDKTKVTCRIVAVKLPADVASQRRRKAKQDRNKKTNHSKEYFALLDYSIFITTVDDKVWSCDHIVKAYRCRWYIEILFKGWKSGLKINFNIPQQYVSKQRAEFFFYAVLLMVNLLVMPVFCHALVKGFEKGRVISILKTCQFIAGRLFQIVRLKRLDKLLDQILYHCAYDKRKDRINAIEMMFFETP